MDYDDIIIFVCQAIGNQAAPIWWAIVHNDDFINKEEVSLTSEPRNPEITICQTLDAPDLVEAYEKGQLKGKLKEIAANLDEESNPVAMLLKKKK